MTYTGNSVKDPNNKCFHAHCFRQPHATVLYIRANKWLETLEKINYIDKTKCSQSNASEGMGGVVVVVGFGSRDLSSKYTNVAFHRC